MITPPRASRRAARVAGAAAGALTLLAGLLLPASPAAALHQYCGAAAEGVHLGGYPGATLDNGHPDGDAADAGWTGGGAVGIAKNVALAVNRATAFVSMFMTVADNGMFVAPAKEVKLGFAITTLAMGIANTATSATVMALEQRVAEVNACNSVMAGDMIDLLFVARMQEELVGLDPADGTVQVPSNLFLLPDDGAPSWTDFAPRYTDRPGHQDLEIPHVDGYADNASVGVATVVRNTIAHLEAHGIDTGGGYVWVPNVGLRYQDGAKDLWWDGMHLLEDGRVRRAYAKFGEAYRMAVTTETTS